VFFKAETGKSRLSTECIDQTVMTIRKIISGGQTGADQAALDVAIDYGIPHGGWIPKGRKTEKGRLPDKYRLKELSSIDYAKRTELNVIDSEGTLILSHGPLTGGSALTKSLAKKHNRSCLHVDLNSMSEYKAVEAIRSWIESRDIHVLNVAGPRASEDLEIYDATQRVLKAVIYPPPERMTPQYPKTVEEAVERLMTKMPLEEKVRLTKLEEGELPLLNHSLGAYIREHFGLVMNNDLRQSVNAVAGEKIFHEDRASVIIIHELWKRLRQTHAMRVVK